MPKGQYTRKPRHDAEVKMPETPAVPAFDPTPEQVQVIAEEMQKPGDILAVPKEELRPEPEPAPEPESFDDWMDEPVPAAPNDTMVGQKVRTWAGSVCAIQHGVTWAPVADSSAIEVVLTTIHGTARMRKPVGQWTEADVDFALEAMRDDLRV